MRFERYSQSSLFAAFLLVGPVFYCAAVFLNLLFPIFDLHVIQWIPIPEFQRRMNDLAPLGIVYANRYQLICMALTMAFLIQSFLAIKMSFLAQYTSTVKKQFYLKLAGGIKFTLACLALFGFCYIVFFSPLLLLESNSRTGRIYNATDLKFFVYWGLSIFVSQVIGFMISHMFSIVGAVTRGMSRH